MQVSIIFDDASIGVFSESEIDYFAYYCSIFKINATCKIIIKSPLSSRINKLKVGTPFTVTFSSDSESYSNKMQILTFARADNDAVISMTILGVSPLFFNNTEFTCAYTGTVEKIVKRVIATDLTKEITEKKIETTDDRSTIRYRIAEEPQEFISRMMKYGSINGGPIYIYHDAKGVFNLRGIESMKSADENTKYVSFTPEGEYSNLKSKLDTTSPTLTMTSANLAINNGKQISQITSKLCTELFRSSKVTPSEMKEDIEQWSIQKNNASVAMCYPSRTDFYDWYISPDDAKCMAYKKGFEDLGMFQLLKATYIDFKIKELDLGNIHYVLLPYTPTETSSNGSLVNNSEGEYLVLETTFIHQDSINKTEATLTQIGC